MRERSEQAQDSVFGSRAMAGRSSPVWPLQARVLRLSVTDRCNFRCLYCMPSEGVPKAPHGELLSLEELGAITAWLSSNVGIERVKLTGGEPLVRKGLEWLTAQLAGTAGIREVSMTTNASLLAAKAKALREAGLARVNVSLDSLDPARYARLTRGGVLSDTLRGIDMARATGLTPVKINTVLQRSTWREELPALLDYAAANQFEIRFMELMRTGTERAWCEYEFISVDSVRNWLARRGHIFELASSGAEPAERTLVYWRGHTVEVGWIAPRSRPFCAFCERLRLDARGRLRRCLMDCATFDLRLFAGSQIGVDATNALRTYLQEKTPPQAMDHHASMSLIGG